MSSIVNSLATWSNLTAEERNKVVGDALGMKPLTQCYIGYLGEKLLRTCFEEEKIKEAQETVDFMGRTDGNWKHFLQSMPSLRPEMRGKLEVIVDRWHLRYSDTPGGGWEVIEWLRDRGEVKVESESGAWRVSFDDGHPHHGRVTALSLSMADAACLVALRVAPSLAKSI